MNQREWERERERDITNYTRHSDQNKEINKILLFRQALWDGLIFKIANLFNRLKQLLEVLIQLCFYFGGCRLNCIVYNLILPTPFTWIRMDKISETPHCVGFTLKPAGRHYIASFCRASCLFFKLLFLVFCPVFIGNTVQFNSTTSGIASKIMMKLNQRLSKTQH